MTKWEWAGAVPVGGDVFSFAVSPAFTAPGQVLAGTQAGLYRSVDCGQNWQRIGNGLGAFPVMAVSLAHNDSPNPAILLGGAPGMIIRSADDGQSWERSDLGYPDVVATVLAISPSYGHDGFVLAGTAKDGIYCSTTKGRHWKTANFGVPDLNVWSLAISPRWETDQIALAVVGDGLFQTTNGARAWKAIGARELKAVPLQVTAISPTFGEDNTVYVGTEGNGVWCSFDRGNHWEPAQGTQGVSINCLAFSSTYAGDRTLYTGTVEKGILCSGDGGKTWAAMGHWDLPPVWALAEIVSEEGRLLLAGVQGQGVFRFIARGGSS
jgi:hypothetical protein